MVGCTRGSVGPGFFPAPCGFGSRFCLVSAVGTGRRFVLEERCHADGVCKAAVVVIWGNLRSQRTAGFRPSDLAVTVRSTGAVSPEALDHFPCGSSVVLSSGQVGGGCQEAVHSKEHFAEKRGRVLLLGTKLLLPVSGWEGPKA